MAKADLTGQVFGFLTVIKFDSFRSGKNHWACRCVCGKETSVAINNLRNKIRSCGCKKIPHRTHGASLDPLKKRAYRIYGGIRTRCYNKNDQAYPAYGGRGIIMSDDWFNDFMCFYNDMGQPPTDNHQIDRINNDKGYNKSNCRWATHKEQQNNRRYCIKILYKGTLMTLRSISDITNIKHGTLYAKYLRGEDLTNIETCRKRGQNKK